MTRSTLGATLASALVVAALAGCGTPSGPPAGPSTAATAPGAATAAPANTSASEPTAPPATTAAAHPAADATLHLGDGTSLELDVTGSTGPNGGIRLRCSEPSLEGSLIEVLSPSATDAPSVRMVIRPTASGPRIDVTLTTGTGDAFALKTFTGSAISAFDAAKGATFDTPLTQAAANDKNNALPSLTSVNGSVDCGAQTPGRSTIAISDSGSAGVDGALDPASVACFGGDQGVSVVGIVDPGAGATRRLAVIALQPTAIRMTLIAAGTPPLVFGAESAPQLTSSGATVDALLAAGAGGGSLRLAGAATCGNIDG